MEGGFPDPLLHPFLWSNNAQELQWEYACNPNDFPFKEVIKSYNILQINHYPKELPYRIHITFQFLGPDKCETNFLTTSLYIPAR